MRLSIRKGAWSEGNPRNFAGNRGPGAPIILSGTFSGRIFSPYPSTTMVFEQHAIRGVTHHFMISSSGLHNPPQPQMGLNTRRVR